MTELLVLVPVNLGHLPIVVYKIFSIWYNFKDEIGLFIEV
jgi:hypothetical protein